ncbi:MAG: RNA 2',3'-cyclic phosphodiesterase [Nevskiaceae bacterium]|nr:MAG: RNA 2',3'-cyclic phosphodiesterase [Nevskiaceae bacterium]
MAEPNRLFFALWPDEAARAACAAAARDLKLRMQPDGYLLRPERYHLTLTYLGDAVPPAQEQAALQVARRMSLPPFTLLLDQAGSFRNREVPWYLAARETPPELTLLHDRLRDELRAAGVAVERMRFAPHLTVVRNASVALPPTRIEPVRWAVNEFVLIRSVLHRQPAVYELLGRWPLDGRMPAPPSTEQMTLF